MYAKKNESLQISLYSCQQDIDISMLKKVMSPCIFKYCPEEGDRMIFIANLSSLQRGILFIMAGLILLLHTLGIIEKGLGYIIIAGSIAMIGYGVYLMEGHKKIVVLLQKKQ